MAQFTAPTPAMMSSVGDTVTLAASASGPTTSTTVGYGFDPAGFRRTRTVGSQTTRFLLGGLIETTTTGTITGFDVDGPAGDLAHYTTAPSSAVNPTYAYYSGHGDLAAEADQTGTRTRLIRLDPWGQPLTAPGGPDLQELYTGRWDKKHDQVTSLIEMGARPYDPTVGRFLTFDPVDGGSFNEYDYAFQDPVNGLDLSGRAPDPSTGDPIERWVLTRWDRATFSSKEASIRYHHGKHGAGRTVQQYTRDALDFRDENWEERRRIKIDEGRRTGWKITGPNKSFGIYSDSGRIVSFGYEGSGSQPPKPPGTASGIRGYRGVGGGGAARFMWL